MHFTHRLSVIFFKLIVLLLCIESLRFQCQFTDVVAFGIDDFHRGERCKEIARTEGKISLPHAYNCKSTIVDVDGFANTVHVWTEKMLLLVVVNHNHLSVLLQIQVVDESATSQFGTVYFLLLRIDSSECHTQMLLADGCRQAALLHGGCHLRHILFETFLGHADVPVVQLNPSPFLDAVERLGSESRIDVDGIQRKSFGVLLQRMDDAIAGTEQHDEQENATRHRNARCRRTHLVAHDGSPYFLQSINHFMVPSIENGLRLASVTCSISPMTPSLMWMIFSAW